MTDGTQDPTIDGVNSSVLGLGSLVDPQCLSEVLIYPGARLTRGQQTSVAQTSAFCWRTSAVPAPKANEVGVAQPGYVAEV